VQRFAIGGRCPAKWSILGVPFPLAFAKVAPTWGSKFHRAREMRRRARSERIPNFQRDPTTIAAVPKPNTVANSCATPYFGCETRKPLGAGLRTYLHEYKHEARDFVARLTICGLKHEKTIVCTNFIGLFIVFEFCYGNLHLLRWFNKETGSSCVVSLKWWDSFTEFCALACIILLFSYNVYYFPICDPWRKIITNSLCCSHLIIRQANKIEKFGLFVFGDN